MGDMADDFNALHRESQFRRAFNRQASAKILAHHRVQFESKSDGAHLIVRHEGRVVDFWPGTGKWIVREPIETVLDGRGVFPLLDYLGVKPCA